MEKIRMLLSLVLLTTLAGICRADKGVDLADENAQLKQRVDKLEKEVEELKKLVMQQAQTQPAAQPVVPAAPAVAAKPVEPNAGTLKLSEADMQKIMAMLEKEPTTKKPVWANLDIQLYGYIKADASYDSSRANAGDYILYANSPATTNNGKGFNLTANQTRLGSKISGPDDGNMKTSGLVEIDFYGNAGSPPENKPQPMMRQAYLNIECPAERFSILAGQTSDVISPLWPETLNYTVMWDGGNIGYRRPQIRLTKNCALNKDVDLKLEGAVSRTIGQNDTLTSGAATSSTDSGANEGFPTVQARVSATFPSFGYKPATIGVSGHYGKEEFDIDTAGDKQKFESWSLNLDVSQPINRVLAVKGELFTGQTLGSYLGGIGQNISPATPTVAAPSDEIKAHGGWIAATLGPCDKWRFNFGAGIDDADNDDLTVVGERKLNRNIFGNVIYSLNKSTEVGFELSQWRTEYKGQGTANDLRAQTSFIYKF